MIDDNNNLPECWGNPDEDNDEIVFILVDNKGEKSLRIHRFITTSFSQVIRIVLPSVEYAHYDDFRRGELVRYVVKNAIEVDSCSRHNAQRILSIHIFPLAHGTHSRRPTVRHLTPYQPPIRSTSGKFPP